MPESNFRMLDLRSLMGELNANQMGIDLFPSANMNVGYFLNSTDRLNRFLTQQPNGRILRNPQPDVVEVMPPGYDPSAQMPYPRGQRPPTQQGGDVNVVPSSLPAWDLSKWLGQWVGATDVVSVETKLAIGLFVLAVIIVAAGFFSLR